MIEQDYIDTIIALPESLFFNTGIPTYIWIFSNRKPGEKKNKIQLIDARKSKTQLRKNLGNKRFEISKEDAVLWFRDISSRDGALYRTCKRYLGRCYSS